MAKCDGATLFGDDTLRRARASGEATLLPGRHVVTPLELTRMVDLGGKSSVDYIRAGVGTPCQVTSGAEMLQRAQEEHASIRVRRAHVLDETIGELAFSAHRALDEEINVNAYWSAPRTELGLAPHSDGYDIVVIQVLGCKQWRLHEPVPRDLTLRAGDAFFLPKRLRHQAHNPHDEPSLHLSFGIYAKTSRSIVEWLAHELAGSSGDAIGEPFAAAAEQLRVQANALLCAPDAAERFAAHRRAVEYERMFMTPEEHARSDARRYR